MDEANFDLDLRRLKFVEACAYFVNLQNIPAKELKMTSELASLVTEQFNRANINWSTGIFRYSKYLKEYMNEGLPDIENDVINKATINRYSFTSLVDKMAAENRKLHAFAEHMDTNENYIAANLPAHRNLFRRPQTPEDVVDFDQSTENLFSTFTPPQPQTKSVKTPTNGKSLETPSKRSETFASSYDHLHGFSVQIRADAHLDENVPICARDQHLLFNVFGDQWKSSEVVNVYLLKKGKTGFMSNWVKFGARKSNHV